MREVIVGFFNLLPFLTCLAELLCFIGFWYELATKIFQFILLMQWLRIISQNCIKIFVTLSVFLFSWVDENESGTYF